MDGSAPIAKMPKTAKERGKIAPAKLAHVVLRTPPERTQMMLDWYKVVLEGEAMYEAGFGGFITYDDEHHRIAVLGFPGIKEHIDGYAGLHHVAFTYGSLGDLVHTYDRLKGEGILPEFIENLENIPIAEESSLININQQLDESLETIFASDLANESDLSSTTNEPFEPDTLDIYISSDSWIEIFDVNEQKIYFDLARTGDQLSLNGTAPFDVILGFAQGVTIELNGQPFDQSPYTRGGVARFKLEE